MAATAVNVNTHNRTFDVVEIKAQGIDPKTGKERYWIKVSYGKDASGQEKITSFHCASNLKVCMEMIEAFGQEVKTLNAADFGTFMNSVYDKRLYFNIQEGANSDTVFIKKHDRYETPGFLKHVFIPKPAKKAWTAQFTPTIEIDHQLREELDRVARDLQMKQVAARNAALRIALERVNPTNPPIP